MTDAATIAAAKGLKLWNGRGHGDYDRGHFYVAAKSAADAARLLKQVPGCEHSSFTTELRVYYSKGCWGRAMDGITPERGVWVTHHGRNTKPEKIV